MAVVANMEREVMNTQRILTKAAGQSFDLDMLRYFMEQKPNAFGFAVQDDSGETPELSIVRENTTPTMEQLKEFLEKAKDFRAMFYLGQLGSKFHKDDIQPFILSDGDDQPFLTIGLEGDFSKFSDPASGRTEEYNFATKIIIPSLLEICEFANGDLDKITAKVNGELFNNILLSNIGHRGSLTILGLDGEPIWLGKNELGNTYDWGQTSNEHDYAGHKAQLVAAANKAAEVKAAATAPVVEKKSKFSFRSSTPPAIPQDVATKGDAPRASVPTVKQVGATTVVEKSEKRVIRVPAWVHKNEDVKAFYVLTTGALPANWKKKIPVMVEDDVVVPDSMDAMKIMIGENAKKRIAASNTAIGPVKTETAAPVKTEAEVATIKKEENAPIISAKEMDALLEVVANIDSQANKKMATGEIQALEKKLGSFSSSVGVKWQEMINWPVTGLFTIANKNPKAMVLMALEFRNMLREHVKVEDLVDSTVTTTVTKPTENATLTESVVTPKKGFSFRKKAA